VERGDLHAAGEKKWKVLLTITHHDIVMTTTRTKSPTCRILASEEGFNAGQWSGHGIGGIGGGGEVDPAPRRREVRAVHDAVLGPVGRGWVRPGPDAELERGEGGVGVVRGLDGVAVGAGEAVEDGLDGVGVVSVVDAGVEGANTEGGADVVGLGLDELVEAVDGGAC